MIVAAGDFGVCERYTLEPHGKSVVINRLSLFPQELRKRDAIVVFILEKRKRENLTF